MAETKIKKISDAELHSLVEDAQKGNEMQRQMVVYQIAYQFTEEMDKARDRCMRKGVHNYEAVEDQMWKKLEKLIMVFDASKGKSFRNFVREEFILIENQYYKRALKHKYGSNIRLDGVKTNNEGSEIPNYDGVQDIRIRDVVNEIENKQVRLAVSKLVNSNPKKRDQHLFIVNHWLDGCKNCSDLSRKMVDTFGGKANTHLQTIKRFREKCVKELSA